MHMLILWQSFIYGEDLFYAFVDLEKAFDRVPRDVVRWALRQLGVEEWLVQTVMVMYEKARTTVSLRIHQHIRLWLFASETAADRWYCRFLWETLIRHAAFQATYQTVSDNHSRGAHFDGIAIFEGQCLQLCLIATGQLWNRLNATEDDNQTCKRSAGHDCGEISWFNSRHWSHNWHPQSAAAATRAGKLVRDDTEQVGVSWTCSTHRWWPCIWTESQLFGKIDGNCLRAQSILW